MALLGVGFAAVLVALLATRCGSVADRPATGTTVERAGDAEPVTARHSGDQHATRNEVETPQPVTSPTGPSTPARFKLQRGAAGVEGHYHYVGPCEVSDGSGPTIASLQVIRQVHPLTFQLPAATARVRFVCPGFLPIDCDVPAMQDGVRDFGTLTLEPDAALRLRLLRGPTDWNGQVHWSLETDDEYLGGGELEVTAGAAETLVQAPSSRSLSCLLESRERGPFAWCMQPAKFELQSGETRLLEIDVSEQPVGTIRVVGPSRELLPHLQVMSSISENRIGGWVRLDENGRATVRGCEPALLHWSINNCSGWSPLHPRQSPGPDLELEPGQALAGLRLLGEDGTALPFNLGYQPDGPDLAYVGAGAPVQLFDAAMRPRITTLLLWNETLGSMRFPADAVVWHGDLGDLDVRTAERRAGLVVTATGERTSRSGRIAIELSKGGETVATRESDDHCFRFTDVVPGDYDLRWRVGGEPGPQIASALTLAPGAPRLLSAPWPKVVVWHGEVANWRQIPAIDRLPVVRLGVASPAGSPGALVDEAGHFESRMTEGATVPASVEFTFGLVGLPGRLLAVDELAHRVLVEHPTDMHWVALRVRPRGNTGWLVMFPGEGQVIDPRGLQRVLVPSGAVLRGVLLESEGGSADRRVTAWVTVDGSQSEVEVEATGGSWRELRFEREGARMTYELLGPGGTRGWPDFLDRPSTVRLWIAPGTTALRVEFVPGGEQTLEIGTGDLIVR